MSYEKREFIQIQSGTVVLQGRSWNGGAVLLEGHFISEDHTGVVIETRQEDNVLYNDGLSKVLLPAEKIVRLVIDVRLMSRTEDGPMYELSYEEGAKDEE